VLAIQSCWTLGDPIDYNPPDSSVHGIFQARILDSHQILMPDFEILLNLP